MKIKPLNNYVLLKSICDPSKVKLEGGKIIYIDTSWNKAKHASVVCEVVAVPDKLIYGYRDETAGGKPIPKYGSMEWETDMELQPGDEVIIHYMGYLSAFSDDKRVFTIDGQEYFFCLYEQIYLAKRRWKESDEQQFWQTYNASTTKYITNDWMFQNNIVISDTNIYNVIMLNGFILTQPVEKQYKSETIILPNSLLKANKKKVKVCYTGSPNKSYLAPEYTDAEVKSLDIILIDKENDVPLEYTPSFLGKEEFWRMQRNNIYAIETSSSS